MRPRKPGARGSRTTYADAGVDLAAGRKAVELFREQVRSTFRTEVVGDIGGFGGAFSFDASKYSKPLLISGTDGVGTKVMIAEQTGRHDTIGIDLVAMSVNDVASHGAEPLFFLDYVVTGKVDPDVIEQIVRGIAAGCREAGCALIGGEVAEHPGHLADGGYDLAGFCVGAVDQDALVDGSKITAGDVILGLGSSGLHSNGYSLVRKVLLEDMGIKLDDKPLQLGIPLADELLRPTLIYSPAVVQLAADRLVTGLAHVTGGGIPENLGRILPDGLQGAIETSAWQPPPVFDLIASLGQIEPAEMFDTFNMGIGMIAVAPSPKANHALDVIRARGFTAYEIGEIRPKRSSDGRPVRIG